MAGKPESIRPCIGCHIGCMGRMFEGKPESCTVNPAVGREKEYEIVPAREKKKVMVIGGGVAGMEAARVCMKRQHDVILYEKTDRLGGHLNEASGPDFKADDRRLLQWYQHELEELKVPVIKGTEVDTKLIEKENPDVIIVATGSFPLKLDFPGADKSNVAYAADILEGKKQAGNDVVLIGGGLVGCETALYLAKQSKKVTVVEALGDLMLSRKPIPHMNKTMLIDLLKANQVDVILNSYLAEVTDKAAIISDKSGKRTSLKADTVIISVGYKPDDTLFKNLNGKFGELYLIGDAREAANLMNSIWDAYDVARTI
ncbi:Cinnamate reductase [bioreactor metagenome]|uniref:Cinnamate reductase n=1 Tax=bioreactor metagenome TaxID=1076179 RepID=A0A645E3J6_9ZZZZ